uniref:Protein krueppel n=1 Tax=Anopheles farauti TaxID=69004 RepID=A0A182QNT2_9DIPT
MFFLLIVSFKDCCVYGSFGNSVPACIRRVICIIYRSETVSWTIHTFMMECMILKIPRYLRTCRLCGLHGSHQTMDEDLANKIRVCFGLAISLKDNTLPQTVCTRCTAKVNDVEKYRKFFMFVQLEHFLKRSQYFAKTERNSIKILREPVTEVELPPTGATNGFHPTDRTDQIRNKQPKPRIGLIIKENIIQRPVASRRFHMSSRRLLADSRSYRSRQASASSRRHIYPSPSVSSSSCSDQTSSYKSRRLGLSQASSPHAHPIRSTCHRAALPSSSTSCPLPSTKSSRQPPEKNTSRHSLETNSCRSTSGTNVPRHETTSGLSSTSPHPTSAHNTLPNTSSQSPKQNTSSHPPACKSAPHTASPNILSHPPSSSAPPSTHTRSTPSLPESCSVKPATTALPPAPRGPVSSGRPHPSAHSNSVRPAITSAPRPSPPSVPSSTVRPLGLSNTKRPSIASNAVPPSIPTKASCPTVPAIASCSTLTSVALRSPVPSTTCRLPAPSIACEDSFPKVSSTSPQPPVPSMGVNVQAPSIPLVPTVASSCSLVPVSTIPVRLQNPTSFSSTNATVSTGLAPIEAHLVSPVPPACSPPNSPSPSPPPRSSFPPSPESSPTSPYVLYRSLPSSPTPSIIVPPIYTKVEACDEDEMIETDKFNTLEVVEIGLPSEQISTDAVEPIEALIKEETIKKETIRHETIKQETIKQEKINTVEEKHEPLVGIPPVTDAIEALDLEVLEDGLEEMIEVLEPELEEQIANDSKDDILEQIQSDRKSNDDDDEIEKDSAAEDHGTMVIGEEHLEAGFEEDEKYETVSVVDDDAELVEMVEILEPEFDTEDTTQAECDPTAAVANRRPHQETRRRRRSKISGKELYKSLLTECTVCHKNVERNRLEGHMNRHAGRKPFSCPKEGCSARFHCKHACRLHVRCRHGSETFPCQKCDKVYKAKRDLLGHMRETHTEPRFSCDICSKKFTTKSRLKQHRHYHTNERNHPCHICKMSFYSNFQLKVHMRTHTKFSPYKCTICFKEFRYRHMSKEHLTKDHGIEPSAQKDWVIQYPEPDPEEVEVVQGDTNMVRYNVQRLIEPNEDDAENGTTTMSINPD